MCLSWDALLLSWDASQVVSELGCVAFEWILFCNMNSSDRSELQWIHWKFDLLDCLLLEKLRLENCFWFIAFWIIAFGCLAPLGR